MAAPQGGFVYLAQNCIANKTRNTALYWGKGGINHNVRVRQAEYVHRICGFIQNDGKNSWCLIYPCMHTKIKRMFYLRTTGYMEIWWLGKGSLVIQTH